MSVRTVHVLKATSALLALLAMATPGGSATTPAAGAGAGAGSPFALPAGWQAHNMQPIGYARVPNAARTFKLSMKQVGRRWFLFVADGQLGRAGGGGVDVVEVTDPAKPAVVASIPIDGGNGQLTIGGDVMIVAQQAPFGPKASTRGMFAGSPSTMRSLASIFDVSDPTRPRLISKWMADGWGTHRNVYDGGRYAFMSAYEKGYKGQSVLSILDMADPARPKTVARWAQPGQRDGEPDSSGPEGYHGPATLSADGKRLVMGYTPSLITLDVSDMSKPREIGRLDFSPLPAVGAQAIHTGIPLPGGMVHLSSEPFAQKCDNGEGGSFAMIVDNRDPTKPTLASYYPRPVPPPGAPYRSFCEKGGRFGPHNVNGELHRPELQKPGTLIYQTYFSAGVRVYDISNPYDPRETGWFLPVVGSWDSGDRGLEDVIVDTRGYAYVSDGHKKGVWVLRYTGPVPAAPGGGAPTPAR